MLDLSEVDVDRTKHRGNIMTEARSHADCSCPHEEDWQWKGCKLDTAVLAVKPVDNSREQTCS